MAADITLAIHAGIPTGTEDDQLLERRLSQAGVGVRLAIWDDPRVDWSSSALTIVRSTWDYHFKVPEWASWLDRIESVTRLANPVALVRWNSDKRYLQSLWHAGVPTVPTHYVTQGSGVDLAELGATLDWDPIILKPAVSASARGVARFSRTQLRDSGQAHLDALLSIGAALIQPFMAQVESTRERSLVFIGGEFSHAFTKPAFQTALNSPETTFHQPDASEFAVARQALGALPCESLYARVDLVPSVDGPRLMELEAIEPDLRLRHCEEGLMRLTQNALRWLRDAPRPAQPADTRR